MIDGHAHLNEVEDIGAAISSARSAGVSAIIGVGMDMGSNTATLEIAASFPEIVYPAIGYHPWSIVSDEIEQNLAFIKEKLPVCIALGEVGLDYKAKVKKKSSGMSTNGSCLWQKKLTNPLSFIAVSRMSARTR